MCMESPFDPNVLNWTERSQLYFLLGQLRATPEVAREVIAVFKPGPKNTAPRSKPFQEYLARFETAAAQGREALFGAVAAIAAEMA